MYNLATVLLKNSVKVFVIKLIQIWKIHVFPCLRLIKLNTVGLDLNSIYFKSNVHTAFPEFTGSARGSGVVRSTGMTDDQFRSVLFAVL